MTNKSSDESVLKTITRLIGEEQVLYANGPIDEHGLVRVEALKVELDQCWDLLRQRRALREFGKAADEAHTLVRRQATTNNHTASPTTKRLQR